MWVCVCVFACSCVCACTYLSVCFPSWYYTPKFVSFVHVFHILRYCFMIAIDIVISIPFPPLRALWFLQFDIHGLQFLPLVVITLPYLCPRGISQINMKVFSRELSSSRILLLISERLPKPMAKPLIKGVHRLWFSLFHMTLHPWSQLNRSKIGFCLKDSQSLHVLAECEMAFSYERKPKSIKYTLKKSRLKTPKRKIWNAFSEIGSPKAGPGIIVWKWPDEKSLQIECRVCLAVIGPLR